MSEIEASRNRISRPADTSVLASQALTLSTSPTRSILQCAELAGIIHLLLKGSILRSNISEMLCGFYRVPASLDACPQLFDDLDEVWQRLDSLASNVRPAEPEYDPSDTQLPRWVVDAMHLLRQEVELDRLSPDQLAKLLPRKLVDFVQKRFATSEFGSAYAIGYSLVAHPGYGTIGISFGGPSNCVWFADALAIALKDAIRVFDQ
jgi:hypothetical protein